MFVIRIEGYIVLINLPPPGRYLCMYLQEYTHAHNVKCDVRVLSRI